MSGRRTDNGDGNCVLENQFENLLGRKARLDIQNKWLKESQIELVNMNRKDFDAFIRESEKLKENYKSLKENFATLRANESVWSLHFGFYTEEFARLEEENKRLSKENGEIKELNRQLLINLEKRKEKNRKVHEKLENLKKEVFVFLKEDPESQNLSVCVNDTTAKTSFSTLKTKQLLRDLRRLKKTEKINHQRCV